MRGITTNLLLLLQHGSMYFDDEENDEFSGGFNDGYRSVHQLLQEFKRALNGEANTLNEEDLELLINYFNSEGNREQVTQAFDLAGKLFPFSIDLLLHKTEWLIEQTKFGQALRTLDQVEQLQPRTIETLFLRADIFVEQMRFDDAITLLSSNIEPFTKEERCEIYVELCDIYDTLEEFDEVYNCLKKLLAEDPLHEEGLLRMCFWADITGNAEDAISLYQNALDQNPFNAMLWYNLGAAYHTLKLYEKSAEAFLYCIDLDEQFEFAYRNLGDTYIHLREYDKAIDILERHLKIATPEDIVLETIGDCWTKKKEYTKARKYYRRASNMSPTDDTLFYKIGKTYTLERQWDKAAKNYDAARRLDNLNPNYCVALGDCYLEMDSSKEAIGCYLNAVRLKPSAKNTWLALLKGLYQVGLYEETLNQCDVAQSFCGEKPDFLYVKVAAKLGQGTAKAAAALLEEALHLAPKKLSVLKNIDRDLVHHPILAEVIARFKKRK